MVPISYDYFDGAVLMAFFHIRAVLKGLFCQWRHWPRSVL